MKRKLTAQQRYIRSCIVLFMIALFMSGLTVWPVETELRLALSILPRGSMVHDYLRHVLEGYQQVSYNSPYLLYGYDWLAFAHIVLAILFIGPYKDPVKNIWVVEFGLIACTLILPFAFVAGGQRGIPVWWRLVDCSFGIFGFALLWHCRKRILRLQKFQSIAGNMTPDDTGFGNTRPSAYSRSIN